MVVAALAQRLGWSRVVLVSRLQNFLTNVCNKLECLSLAGLSSLAFMLVGNARAYHEVDHLSEAPGLTC